MYEKNGMNIIQTYQNLILMFYYTSDLEINIVKSLKYIHGYKSLFLKYNTFGRTNIKSSK